MQFGGSFVTYRSTAGGSNRLRVLFVSSEIFPLAKTGGLADVCGSLPMALSQEGDIDMVLMLPGYDSVFNLIKDWEELAALPDLPGGPGRLLLGSMPDTGLRVVALDQPQSFRRQGSLYLDENGKDWADNGQRFAALCHAAAQMAQGKILPFWRADVVHCNDWHTALIPAVLAALPGRKPRTVFTVHNLAFQGLFPREMLSEFGLPESFFSVDGVEYFGQISFMKAALNFADKLTTVSPSYAEEITLPEFGMGLDGMLTRRKADLSGILNGIDDELWDPESDPVLPMRYSAADPLNKVMCKEQKMADTLLEIMPQLLGRPGVQLALVGQGSRPIQDGFRDWTERMPGRVAARIGYREEWAHQLMAAGDMLVHGARFEPCGLTPMYAMRYGAVPIVRAVGGLRDSVTPVNDATLEDGTASGFHFAPPTGTGLMDAVDTALTLFRQRPQWRRVQQAGMRKDFSWQRPAQQYRRLYSDLAAA